jgi:hypothetical protein
VKGPLTFEFVVSASIVGFTEVAVVARSLGPDGVVLAYDLAGARFSVEPSSIRVPLRLWLETKVRSAVVASWVLARLSPLCIGLIHEGRDYRGDPAGLARRVDAWTTDLPDGTPSDPPRDDDGGAGVGARVKKKPPTIDGARLP